MSLPAILTASAALENANKVALGINYAFDTPPEALVDLPVALRFAMPGGQLHGSRLLGRYNIYNFKIEVHLARGVLMESYATALAVIQAYQDLYTANLSISGTCNVSGFGDPELVATPYEGPVRLRYGTETQESIGVVFYMWAKEIVQDITVNL